MKKLLLYFLCFLMFSVTQVYAQSRTVTGTVTGRDDKQPIPGASVRVKGTQVGTVTDVNGRYSINVPAGSNTLVVTFLGYASSEVPAVGKTVDVIMAPSSRELTEVVVTGYGTQTKAAATGPVASVGSKDLEDKPYSSMDQALQGRVAGLQSVGGSGQPGALQQIRIRGIGSITAGSDPLYVVDGVPVNSGDLSSNTTSSSAIAAINPNDIESIQVLKDASQAAIYGSRGANGVIVITTKSGRAGKTKVRLDAEYGYVKPSTLPKAGRPLTTDQWRNLTAEGLVNSGDEPDLATALKDLDDTFGSGSGVNTNWIDEVTRTGHQQQYNLSLEGGDAKTQFHIGAGYFNQQGAVIASSFDRYSTNFNIKHKVNDRLSFATSFTIGENGQNTPSNGGAFSNPVGSAYFLVPYISPYNADGSFNLDPNQFASNYNPLAIAATDKSTLHQVKGIGSLSGEYKILPNFKFTSRVGVDLNALEENTYWNPNFGDGASYGGLSTRNYSRYFNWVATNLLDYHLDVNHDNTWVANIKAGYEAQKSQYYYEFVTTTGLPNNYSINVPSAGATPLTASGDNSDYTFASILSMADITFKGKYALTGSFRRDGSSRFGINNAYGNFGSVGAAWNMHEEEFIKKLDWITLLKIRGSYGSLGNANVGNYAWRPLYSYGQGTDPQGNAYNYNYLGNIGSGFTSLGNENLTWETNKTVDLGFDLSIFKDRLSLTFDWYNRQSDNLLLNQPISLTSGKSSFINNVGSMRNRGYEISLSGTPLILGDFRWNASFSLSHNKNTVLSLINHQQQVSGAFVRKEGLDIQTYYLRQWAGVDPANGNPLWYTDASMTKTTSVYSQAQLVANPKYSASPKYFGSFTSDFTYKGFSLSGLLYYNFGNYIRDSWARYTQGDGYDPLDNHVAAQLDRWQKPGDITNVPKYVFNNSNNSSASSTRFLYKGDYIRLRELTLAYNVPAQAVQKLGISSLRVYLRGTNLATWVRDKNLPYDPETYVNSTTNFDVYNPKTYTLGVNVGF
ncbi:SusC/RagA family TonB-linked outer membrane protein [Mucilaginibacter sp. KACC 22063]|uniref:SusC/RagA family TonB-linked outer membrane protein n=1 Tax=Mucilaginibacter sp. KACC 22063 TaxID=3025666 RepID=UPI002366C690|nr:TonB-dependent receptor [Mucilaginibacter sp. KACC 22063]WDF55273.1 TonB-dependent receptor [Mucilaginibacter sp. KACC 22063]